MRLEDFIKNNKEGFDIESPSKKVWSRIQADLSPSRKEEKMISLSVLYKIAASVILLIGLGTVLGFYIGNAKMSQSDMFANNRYSEVEQFYKKQMEVKMGRLASYNVAPEVTADLQQMDQTFDEIKQDILLDPEMNEEKYINAIIKNYESRIAIMEKVLKRIKHHSEKKKNESYHEQIEI